MAMLWVLLQDPPDGPGGPAGRLSRRLLAGVSEDQHEKLTFLSEYARQSIGSPGDPSSHLEPALSKALGYEL